MAKNYKGKRNTITVPQNVARVIEKLSKDENRTYSQMIVRLCLEAIEVRDIKNG